MFATLVPPRALVQPFEYSTYKRNNLREYLIASSSFSRPFHDGVQLLSDEAVGLTMGSHCVVSLRCIDAAAIAALAEAGISVGVGDGRYAPEQEVTRGQMAAFLRRSLAG